MFSLSLVASVVSPHYYLLKIIGGKWSDRKNTLLVLSKLINGVEN
jgi:hypothetical protein